MSIGGAFGPCSVTFTLTFHKPECVPEIPCNCKPLPRRKENEA